MTTVTEHKYGFLLQCDLGCGEYRVWNSKQAAVEVTGTREWCEAWLVRRNAFVAA